MIIRCSIFYLATLWGLCEIYASDSKTSWNFPYTKKHLHKVKEDIFAQSNELLAAQFTAFRMFYAVTINSAFNRKIVGQQLGFGKELGVPSYPPSYMNRFVDLYAAGMARALSLVIHNGSTSVAYTYNNYNPLIMSVVLGGLSAAFTPLDYLVTKKTESVCLWRQGKITKPLSYKTILYNDFGGKLWKGSVCNGISSSLSWFSFLYYTSYFLKKTDEKRLTPANLTLYANLCACIEATTFTPFYNIQRYMQQHSQRNLTLRSAFSEIYGTMGPKGFYRGGRLIYLMTFFSSFPDLSYLRWIRDKERKCIVEK
ncbi:MAG: hypothetical protein K2X98_05305 [Alphaproteobacteria bacterium]|nr:hypothetical protein [Alphaproteobacteria bacterium]